MSLAPASSRGAFLKARLAVNGIQCAARSLGTLTAAGSGLLSSIGASLSFRISRVFGYGGFGASYQLRCETGTPRPRYIYSQSDGLRALRGTSRAGLAGAGHMNERLATGHS